MFPELTQKTFASISAVTDLKSMKPPKGHRGKTKKLMVGGEKDALMRDPTITFYFESSVLLGFIVLCFHLVVKCGRRSLCRGGRKSLKALLPVAFLHFLKG